MLVLGIRVETVVENGKKVAHDSRKTAGSGRLEWPQAGNLPQPATGLTVVAIDRAELTGGAGANLINAAAFTGDTVIATLALALAAGASTAEAAYLANVGAGIVVGKFGPATASATELLAQLSLSLGH
jgi:D-beta-D-heptose 7-phosphate kinase/D-beta-D-heptose 1-phosphate adenosyltransferase